MTERARHWWATISNQVIIALLGFLLWWAQDVLQTYRAQTAEVLREQRQHRREMDDLMFRVKALEMRVDVLRTRRWVPPPKYEDPVE